MTYNLKVRFILYFSLIILLIFPALEAKDKKDRNLNHKIEQITRKLSDLKQEKKSVLNNIYELELRYEKTVIEKNRISLTLRNSKKRIAALKREKESLKKKIGKSKEKLKQILRILYKMRGNVVLRIFSGITSVNQIFHNHKLLNCLIEDNTKTLAELRKDIKTLETIESKLSGEQSIQLAKESELNNKLKELRNHRQNKLDAIRKINNDRDKYQRYIDELKEEAGKMNKMLEEQIVTGSFNVKKNLNRIKGRMMWPIKGRVISRFGRKRSTKFNTYIFSNGIEIKRRRSSSIKSVLNGEVIWVDYKKGYGKIIVVQHSKDLYTIYGHCSEIKRKKGDIVKKGETIALTGSSGSSLKESLYFEIRHRLRAVNPLKWLRKR